MAALRSPLLALWCRCCPRHRWPPFCILQLPRWMSEALLLGASGVFFRSSSPAAWGGLLRPPPAGLNGCRTPAPMLRCYLGSYSRCYPKWLFPGGDTAAVVRRSPSAARWTPEGPDHVSALLSGSFLYFYWAVLYFPSF
jgi:hypothetical protein